MTDIATPSKLEGPIVRSAFRAFDFDQHFFEPQSLWSEYLPAKFADMAPREGVDSLGLKRHIIGGVTLSRSPRVPAPRKPAIMPGRVDSEENYGLAERVVRAGSDPQTRLELLDSEGVRGAVIYPTTGLYFGGVKNLEFLSALCTAYNNWAADYCRADPARLFAAAMVPQLDVTATLVEARRALTQLGFRIIVMRPNPIGPSVEDPAWEPLWQLLADHSAAVAFHEGTALCVPHLGADRTDNFIFQHMMSHPFEHMAAMLSMIGAGILDRHPDLRAFFVEAGCGWVPYWLERMEHHFRSPYLGAQLSLSPTELFLRQCWVTSDVEEGSGVVNFINSLGPDNVCWSTDFPHPDHEWGGVVEEFASRKDLTDNQKRKVGFENAERACGI